MSVASTVVVQEGSSLTLNCSNDANPEANYTWHDDNKDLPLTPGQNTISDISSTNATKLVLWDVGVTRGGEEHADARVPAVHLGKNFVNH